ncbi:LytTR family DNA-binding domain-containing protein [Planktomarina temperata]|uniref:LytTR family DNA-binding domain-containing protein n=1 Tax=Planktomarina temperata TaxID=1284658 RepID=UPI003F6A4D2C
MVEGCRRLKRENCATSKLTPSRNSPGLQVHRSHWVSFDAIDKTERRGDGARLILADGASAPVSRSHMPCLRAKGVV